MPLALTDSRWNELQSSYGDTADVVAWLTIAYHEGGLTDERLGEIVNEVQHQGGTSTAMYGVALHLVVLARQAAPEEALLWLTQAGMIYADAARSDAVACPDFLAEEFAASALEGTRLLSRLLPVANDFDLYKGAVSGLSGFMGHCAFARFLNGLEFYEGKFHHVLIKGPFPSEN